jgi:hypothetical protein
MRLTFAIAARDAIAFFDQHDNLEYRMVQSLQRRQAARFFAVSWIGKKFAMRAST